RLAQLVVIAGEFAVEPNLTVERDDHYLIISLQLLDESEGGVLDVFYLEHGAMGCVEHKRDMKRRLDRIDVFNILLHALLVEQEIALAKERNEFAVAVYDADRNADELRVQLDRSVFINGYRRVVGQSSVGTLLLFGIFRDLPFALRRRGR